MSGNPPLRAIYYVEWKPSEAAAWTRVSGPTNIDAACIVREHMACLLLLPGVDQTAATRLVKR